MNGKAFEIVFGEPRNRRRADRPPPCHPPCRPPYAVAENHSRSATWTTVGRCCRRRWMGQGSEAERLGF
ncbi:hypothetical protein V6Z11_A03G105400 [Gossypium hirsutum]